MADDRFLSVKYKTLDIAEVNVSRAFPIATAPIHPYYKNNKRITKWAQFSALSEDYFIEAGSFVTILTVYTPPSIKLSSLSVAADLEAAKPVSKKRRIDNSLLPYPLEDVRNLYVRKCYNDVFDLLVTGVEKELRYFTITGSPGIGKSFFFPYILYRLMKLCRSSSFNAARIVHQTTDNYHCFDLEKHTVHEVTKRQAKNLVWQSDTLYIIDGYHSPVLLSSCVTLLIASPGSQNYQQFIKHTQRLEWCFPVWTEDELNACRKQCYSNIPEEVLHERFRTYGGIARSIFKADLSLPPVDMEVALADPIAVSRVRNFGAHEGVNGKVHLLMHMIPSDDGQYRFSHAAIASKYVCEQLWQNQTDQMISNLQDMLGYGTTEVSQPLFETYAHRVLSSGGLKLRCRNLMTGARSLLKLDTLDAVRVPLKQNSLPHRPILQYHQTTGNETFRDIDAFSPQGLFKVMDKTEHSIQDVENLTRLCAAYDNPKLYFVVPEHCFETFAIQSFLPTNEECGAIAVENLELYVMDLPVRPYQKLRNYSVMKREREFISFLKASGFLDQPVQ
ncbi:hypothetical protein HDU81_005252 [Chytriomyces hyalinus]|nr:hypothetical protein HDU81_005252 [Chytriomyces hyalinus]